ncbi:hypothetical protein OS493_017595 [Desmophyllum pertusum]|uniref:Uncharacterized protein n=1 Tax=Desmophyllum pertusum TaxID=174260 RepID=A0A9W9ZNZ9_9CNID|nr:hypothetical protein OS493_017595 [Desmophyllum pertusum]
MVSFEKLSKSWIAVMSRSRVKKDRRTTVACKEQQNLPDLTKVRDVLYNSRPNEEIIRQGICITDVTDF